MDWTHICPLDILASTKLANMDWTHTCPLDILASTKLAKVLDSKHCLSAFTYRPSRNIVMGESVTIVKPDFHSYLLPAASEVSRIGYAQIGETTTVYLLEFGRVSSQ